MANENVELMRGEPEIAVRKLAIPIMISMLLTASYNIVDGIWVAGLGQAAKDMYANLEANRKHLFALKERLAERLSKVEGDTLNGIPEEGILATAPHVLSVSFAGIRSEVLLHALEEKGVYVSSGSACSSNHPDISGTLVAIGVKKELLDATLRFSFSVTTTIEEIDYAADCVETLLPQLRRFFRK